MSSPRPNGTLLASIAHCCISTLKSSGDPLVVLVQALKEGSIRVSPPPLPWASKHASNKVYLHDSQCRTSSKTGCSKYWCFTSSIRSCLRVIEEMHAINTVIHCPLRCINFWIFRLLCTLYCVLLPFTLILFSILHLNNPPTTPLVIQKLSFIPASIFIDADTHPVHTSLVLDLLCCSKIMASGTLPCLHFTMMRMMPFYNNCD